MRWDGIYCGGEKIPEYLSCDKNGKEREIRLRDYILQIKSLV